MIEMRTETGDEAAAPSILGTDLVAETTVTMTTTAIQTRSLTAVVKLQGDAGAVDPEGMIASKLESGKQWESHDGVRLQKTVAMISPIFISYARHVSFHS